MIGVIGSNGFVGSSVVRALSGEDLVLIDRSNIRSCSNRNYDVLIICAGEARKWFVNSNVKVAIENVIGLFNDLKLYQAKKVIYFSTIDVYNKDIKEKDGYSTEPYGLTKLVLEELISSAFENCVVVRLGALFGNGLKKNFLFDLLNRRKDWIELQSASSGFQYYNMGEMSILLNSVIDLKGQNIVDAFSDVVYNYEVLNHLNLDYSLGGLRPTVYDIPKIDGHVIIRPAKAQILKQISTWFDENSL